MELELRINGVVASSNVSPNESLLTMLRREGYASVKHGCETGECGACTVVVDGVARPSCVMLAAQAGGCTLSTVESLGSGHSLHPLQEAFVEVGAVQCGFCTPGMLLSAHALLQQNTRPTEAEVRDALSGNLCRCTGYAKPIQAVLRAAAVMRGERVAPIDYDGTQGNGNGVGSTSPTTTGKMRTVTADGTTSKLAAVFSALPLQVVGKPVPPIDAGKLVTGRPVFTEDMQIRGALHARILTSPHAHAVIRSINVAEAKALPGVHAVLTYQDIQRIAYSGVERSPTDGGPYDQYCLDYTVRYVGDRVAVVAAETPEVAEQALGLIQVEYDVQPPILDVRQALEPGVARIHPESESHGIADVERNVAARVRTEVGDMEHSFAEADVVVEGEYSEAQTQQAPIENHAVVTYFDEENYLVIRTSSQVPHHIRRTVAHILGLPSHRIRVVTPNTGGNFGVKQEIVLEDLCALLTVITNRPILLSYSRAEEFRSSRIRHTHVIRLKTGVKRDGTIVANQMIVLASTGAYGTDPLTTRSGAAATAQVLSLYPCSAMRFVAEVLYTNLPPSAAQRSYEAAQEFFALESHMDEIARQLNMDALELRRKNMLKAGDEDVLAKSSGEGSYRIESCGLPECLQIVEEKVAWKEKRGQRGNGRMRRGVGIALSLRRDIAASTSGAFMKLNEDGSFDVFTGSSGSTNTLLVQIIAEVLAVPLDLIHLHTSETDSVPSDTGIGASTSLYSSGGAVKRAAEQMRRQLFGVAGHMLSMRPEVLKLQNGTIIAPDKQTLTIEQVAAFALYNENRHIMTTASWKSQQVPPSFAAQGVEVEIDTEMGTVRVIKAVTAVDGGQILNPLIAEGQIEGSVARALGTGISEELLYDQQGAILTTTLGEYGIFTAQDMPKLDTHLVKTVNSSDPFGAKSVAEVSGLGIAPAIANAVADALGIRMRQVPITPERVLRALHAQVRR